MNKEYGHNPIILQKNKFGMVAIYIYLFILITLFSGNVYPSGLSQTFQTQPEVVTWSNQNQITVHWSNVTGSFSTVSGYLYNFDQDLETSIPEPGFSFTQSTTVTSSILSTGIYYFHLWPVNSTGSTSSIVFTVGPFFISPYAPDIPVLGDIPDIKLLSTDTQTKVFDLKNYSSNTEAPWSWSLDTVWKYHSDLGIGIQQNGTSMIYQPDTSTTLTGRQRIIYSADKIFNNRSVLKLSSHLWKENLPEVIFKNGQPVENHIIDLTNYILSSDSAPNPQFEAYVTGNTNLYSAITGTELTISTNSIISYPSKIRLTVYGNDSVNDWDSDFIRVYENWVNNGDFQNNISDNWAYLNSGTNKHSTSWINSDGIQTGFLKLTQWSSSSIKMVQNINNNPNEGSPFLPIHGGTWYKLRARLRTDLSLPLSNRNVSLQVHGYYGYKNDTTLSSVTLATLPLDTIWRNYEVSFYSRSNIAAVVLVSDTRSSPTSTIYIDDIQFIESEPEVVSALGNTRVDLPNDNFNQNLDNWYFEGVKEPLQSQDTGWLSELGTRKGVCVLNPSSRARTKMTQIITMDTSESQNIRFRIWAATDAPDQNSSPTLILVLNTYDANTVELLDVLGYGAFKVAAKGKWARYDFSCPVQAPVLALQVQGWGLYSTKLYIDEIEFDMEQDLPSYWNQDHIYETEFITIDSTDPAFFAYAETNDRFVPVGSNLHVYAQPLGLRDDWWNPYSEDSFSPLYFDTNLELLNHIGGNIVKLTILLDDFLPDFDYEINPVNTNGQTFPTYQSLTNLQIPPRMWNRVDQLVAIARQNHQRIILTIPFYRVDLNWWLAGGGNFGDTTQLIISEFWKRFTERYKDDPIILSYSLLVEHQLRLREWSDTTFAYIQAHNDKYYTAPVSDHWHDWLRIKYGNNIANLNNSWNSIPASYRKYPTGLPYPDFDSIPIPGFDGKNHTGSSNFTNGMGGGGDPSHQIPDSPIRLDFGMTSTIQWMPTGDTTYLNRYYIWRKEKSLFDPVSFGTTWQFYGEIPVNVNSVTDYNVSSDSAYLYEITGANIDVWRNYPEGSTENENATYDPMLFDYMLFRESVVDKYNYNQTSTIVHTETGGDLSKDRHLTSLGLSQFLYLLRWPVTARRVNDIPSLTPEGPDSIMGYNPKELVKSLDFSEVSYYTGFPFVPSTPMNPNTGYPLLNGFEVINYENINTNLQYLRTLLRLFHSHSNPDLRKPILLKEIGAEGTDLEVQNQWNNILLDYTQNESAGILIWNLAFDHYGVFTPDYVITPWGESFRRRADDLKYTHRSYPDSTQTMNFTGGIGTTSNYHFLLTSSEYRHENISPSYDPSGNYITLGKILRNAKLGIIKPNDHIDILWPDNSTIPLKPEF